MAGSLGNLYFKIGADVRDAVSGINKIEKQIGQFQRSLGSLGKGLLGAASFAGVIDIARQAIQSSIQLEKAFLKIKNLTDSSATDLKLFKSSLSGISSTLGVSVNDLADGLYNITSAGATGARAIQTLEIAAKGAAVGMGSTDEIAKALTSTLNAYGENNLTAARAAEIFFKTTKSGALDIRELTASMSNVTPLASALGVSLEQVGAFLATASLKGTQASEAITQLASILNSIINPTQEARKIMDAIGLSMDDLQAMIKTDFRGAMLELEKRFGGSAEAMAKFFGRKEAVIGFLSVVGGSAAKYGSILQDIQKDTALLDKATDEAMNTLEGRWNKAVAIWKNALTVLGDILATTTLIAVEKVSYLDEAGGIEKVNDAIRQQRREVIGLIAEKNKLANRFSSGNTYGILGAPGGPTAQGLVNPAAGPQVDEAIDKYSKLRQEIEKLFNGVGSKKLKIVDNEELARLDLAKLKTGEILDDINRIIDKANLPLTSFEQGDLFRQFQFVVPDNLPTNPLKEVISQTEDGIKKQKESLDKSWDEYITKGQQASEIAQAVGAASADAFFNLGSALVDGASGFRALGLAALDAASQIIKAALAAAIAEAVTKSIKKSPNIIVGLALAAIAIGVVKSLFAKVPKLAQGGLAYRPQLAIVGDNPNAAADPEVISPLSRLNALLANQINNLAGLLTRSFNQSLQAIYASPATPQVVPLSFRDAVEVNVKGKIEGNDIRLAYDRNANIHNRHQPNY